MMFQGVLLFKTGNPTEKLSEFFNHHLQHIMKAGKSYIKDTGDFFRKALKSWQYSI